MHRAKGNIDFKLSRIRKGLMLYVSVCDRFSLSPPFPHAPPAAAAAERTLSAYAGSSARSSSSGEDALSLSGETAPQGISFLYTARRDPSLLKILTSLIARPLSRGA